ncbi:anti-anti-sigma factor [Rhodococcus sp. EPR-157]|uniref:STAS domain-containing protein n=1 Tax=Rhodococcus sp. EPR-157 TaxID=1813677 RepID=UPI0007BC5C54|nr:STAS domain-containing protein [Rhodococcus sp. EPR-157]KZF02596.1 anti-anti-sigma factor [Rhodococcus sp. EPR-157]
MTADSVAVPFEVGVTRRGGLVVLNVRGEVDLVTAPQLTESIDTVLTELEPTALIVDLTNVPFLASMGMSVLAEANRRIGDAAVFAVVADGPSTARPLTMMGLDQQFVIYTDLDAAVAAVAA